MIAQLPNTREHEISIVSILLVHSEHIKRASKAIGVSDFMNVRMRLIYQALLKVQDDDGILTASVSIVGDRLRVDGQLEQAGGYVYVAEIADACPGDATLDYHLAKMAEESAVRRLADQTKRDLRDINNFRSDPEAQKRVQDKIGKRSNSNSPRPVMVCLADVQPESIKWLWPNRIPLGKLCLICGNGGLGKSTVLLDVTSRITTGCGFPDDPGTQYDPGNVIIMTAEDGLADTVRPRIDAAGGDPSRIHVLKSIYDPKSSPGNQDERWFSLQDDLAHLETAIRSVGDVRMVFIDPVTSYLDGVDDHRNAEVRSVLGPLSELAERCGSSISLITHMNKSSGSALHRVIGSIAWGAAVRMAWAFCDDPDDSSRKLMLNLKSNLAPNVGGLAYRTKPCLSNPDVAYIEWESDPVEMTADEAFAAIILKRQDGLTDTENWLVDMLPEGVPVPAKQVMSQAKEDGVSERTLNRAKKKLGVISDRDVASGCWVWIRKNEPRLPLSDKVATPGEWQPCDKVATLDGNAQESLDSGHGHSGSNFDDEAALGSPLTPSTTNMVTENCPKTGYVSEPLLGTEGLVSTGIFLTPTKPDNGTLQGVPA